MNKTISYCLISILLIFNFANAQTSLPWRVGEQQVKVIKGTASENANQALHIIKTANSLGMRISYEEADGFFRCYVTHKEAGYLKEKGLEIITEIEDLNAYSASFGERGVPTGYYTVEELNEIADSLALNFPAICTKHLLGSGSFSHELWALKISDNSSLDENEPELLFDGGIHGDEIGGPENLIRFARDLCLGYDNNPDMTYAVDNAETWIIYCINPYGRDFMTRYNANGVDVNRDCGYMWNAEGNSTGIFSQPETKVLRNMLRAHQFVIHISYHSGTEFISYPWSYREELTPDNANHEFLAQQYASNSGYTNIPIGPGFSGMYAINGSTKDYGYGATGAISWSMEISLSKQPPASQIVSYYLKNKGAMLAMINNAAGQGINGTITDAITGDPISATVFINDLFPVNTYEATGDYHKFLTPGTYTVRIIANGYLTEELSGVTINNGLQTTLNVSMTRGGGYFASSLSSCHIPNNNTADEGNTPAALGAPDNIAYSIGRVGSIVLDMGTTILNREGVDFRVYENDATPEGYKVYAANTPDGPWMLLGNGNATSSFDLSATILYQARYIRITDDGDGSSQVPDAGFDLDAIENLHPDTLTVGWVSGIVYNDQSPYFAIPGALVALNNNEVISDENGAFIIASVEGEFEISATAPYYEGTDTVLVVLGDTLSHDMHLHLTDKANYLDSSHRFTVYPFNARDHFMLYGPDGQYTMEIFNIQGSKLDEVSIHLNENGYLYRTLRLNTGLFIIRLTNQTAAVSLKVFVNN